MNELSDIIDKALHLLQYDPKAPLIFSSGLFLFLFLGFTFFYQFMRRAVLLRVIYVSLFSLYFYYKTSGFFFLLLVAVSISDFLIGKGIARCEKRSARRSLLALSVILDIGLLVYFKYTNFFIEIINGLSGRHWLDFQNIFLPVGISFFVFQSISYTADIYRRRIEPLRKWIDYLFYLSFFPQLVAGPIVRARDFIPQIHQNPLRVTREMFGTGVFLIISGLFKKAIISDYISLNFVDRVFDDPLLYSGFENLMGLYGYALQIYCDFSGYSDMAIGIALLLGFHFNKNFDSPYKSATITEFWHRWHISLSSWLKDYLYISLGGNRKGHVRTCCSEDSGTAPHGDSFCGELGTGSPWPCTNGLWPMSQDSKRKEPICLSGDVVSVSSSPSTSSASAGSCSVLPICKPSAICSRKSLLISNRH